MAKTVQGFWSAPIDFDNVPVHASLLPNGKILYWGRRENPKVPVNDVNLNEKKTSAFVWDPDSFFWDPVSKTSKAKFSDKKPGLSQPTKNQPLAADKKTTVNLFCAGHCFLGDGRLLIVGGHERDGQGIRQACIYDYRTDRFEPQTAMNEGRWYPSALTLPDGRAMVMSGAVSAGGYVANDISQIWTEDPSSPWKEVISSYLPDLGRPPSRPGHLILYPRLHLSPKGQVFMAGPSPRSWFLDVKDAKGAEIEAAKVVGQWVDAGTSRDGMFRDYAPSVMYDSGKIMYIGGGQDENKDQGISVVAPTPMVEYIDLTLGGSKWKVGPSMTNKRRQFNATILPDGTVLVTGGSSGEGFNDLNNTVHQAELFDPYDGTEGKWTKMADESFDRCYHSVALLLPDGRVMSGGGGEYSEPGIKKEYCLTNAQFFEPPYLHREGPRPAIKDYPRRDLVYGESFHVTLGSSETVDKISWVRLGSVTHCRNMNQSLIWLQSFKQTGTDLAITAPADNNISPPGHYMLFVLNKNRVPSVGVIICISLPPSKKPTARMAAEHHPLPPVAPAPTIQPTMAEHNDRLVTERGHPPVTIGITPVCPYGLGPCWGGAHDGLTRMSDIDVVAPLAHQEDSTAHVYLKGDVLPDIDKWRTEFAQTINASYDMRGIEMTLSGVVTKKGESQLTLAGTSTRQELPLAPFRQASQIKWDMQTTAPKPVNDAETGAYERLEAVLAQHPEGAKIQVTGTLQKHDADKFSLDIRDFKVLDAAA